MTGTKQLNDACPFAPGEYRPELLLPSPEALLTPDNHRLPEVTNRASFRAIDRKSDLPEGVADLIRESVAPNTRRAYLSDLARFEAWGGSIPSDAETLARYLAHHAELLSVATLTRRLASLSRAHAARDFSNPVRSELVRATMRGIRRRKGTAQREAKPLLVDDLFRVLAAMGDGRKAARDRALLLLGFAGALRRSELVGLNVEDLEHARQGLILHLRRSKTDQEGEGRKIGIPRGRTSWCPVAAIEVWLSTSGITEGPLFRPVDRHARVLASRLSGERVSLVVKERVAGCGMDPAGYSGHSLRAGLATSAAQAGVAWSKIRAQTGHATDAMLARYVRDGELFLGNAAGQLL